MPIFKGNIYWIIYPTETQPPTSFPAYIKQERGRGGERNKTGGDRGGLPETPNTSVLMILKIKGQKETKILVTEYLVQLLKLYF